MSNEKDNGLDIDFIKKSLIFEILNSPEELRDWLDLYLDLRFPMGTVYPESTHGPVEAMWFIYNLFKTGESVNCPKVTMLASRDSFKTLAAAALEVLCMMHFRIPMAHMAAIKAQSAKAVQYVSAFFRKLAPYLEANGWKKNSDSKTYIEWITEKNEVCYLNIISCTIAGANSEHVPLLVIDEIDVIQNPNALNEASMIPSVFKGYHPITVSLSTRKRSGGLMEKCLKQTIEAGGAILRWNILDVCERITHEEAQINMPKIPRYISRELPMENLTTEEWLALTDEKRNNYERFDAYAGIAEHPMLSVMRNYLADRPQDHFGGLFKPLMAVYNNFKSTPVDMASAQLLCLKPSTSGLVYPRFSDKDNVLTPEQAIERLTFESAPGGLINPYEYLISYLHNLGIPMYGGADWGYTDYTSLSVFAVFPDEEIWLLHNFMQDELELEDIVKYVVELQNKYNVEKWFVDQNYPSYIKTLKRHGINCPKFDKVVSDGIAAIQSKIVNTENIRQFFIVNTSDNKQAIDAFGEYRWALDGRGDMIEGKPYHDKDGVSDFMDSIRYPFQNLFAKGGLKPTMQMSGSGRLKKLKVNPNQSFKKVGQDVNNQLMGNIISGLATEEAPELENKRKKKILIF